jgi:hypothetical protein
MSGSALSDLSGLLALSPASALDLRPVILRVQTDLFVAAKNRDKSMIAAFEALAGGLLPVVDDDTAAIVARKLATIADTPRTLLALLVGRGGEARRAVVEGVGSFDDSLAAAASRDGADLSAMRAARDDLDEAQIAELLSREDAKIDAVLARNPSLAMAGMLLDALITRAGMDSNLAQALLARSDLPTAHRAALYLAADEAQRADIRAAVEPIAAIRAPALPLRDRGACDTLVDCARAGDRQRFAEKLASMLRLAGAVDWNFGNAERHDILALALLAAGIDEEDAIRVFLTLEPSIAFDVEEVFSLVRLFRQTPRATAAYLVEAILGANQRPMVGLHVRQIHEALVRPDVRTGAATRAVAENGLVQRRA